MAESRDRRLLIRWLAEVTRPVLSPLIGSTLLRWVSQLCDLALFFVGFTGVLALATGQAVNLWVLAWTLVGISLAKALTRYLEQFLGHWVAFKALEVLRTELFARLWPQAPAVLSRSRSGDLLERATKDIDRLEVVFAHVVAPAVTAVLTPLVAVLAVGSLVSWPVAAVMAAGLLVSLVAVPFIGAGTTRLAADRTAATRARLTHSVTDSVQGLPEITGYGLQQARLAQASELSAELVATEHGVATTAAVRRGLALLIGLATSVAVVVVGLHTGLGIALLAGALAVTLRCLNATKSVEDFLVSMDASFASAARLWELTHEPPVVRDPVTPRRLPAESATRFPPHAGASAERMGLGLEWRDVTYSYTAEDESAQGGASRAVQKPAVHGVTAEARPGRHTALVGTSGSGKSTLAQLAMRFDDPQEGAVLLDGVDVRELSLANLRSRITHVSQRPFLFNRSVAENLRLADPDASDDALAEACRIALIDSHIASLPQGYDTPVGELAERWSGGQRARLALARALLRPAQVFILDEYNAHLDPELAVEVATSLRRARPEATLVEITHRVSGSLAADHVIVLDRGTVVQAGSPSDLAETDGPYARLLARDTPSPFRTVHQPTRD